MIDDPTLSARALDVDPGDLAAGGVVAFLAAAIPLLAGVGVPIRAGASGRLEDVEVRDASGAWARITTEVTESPARYAVRTLGREHLVYDEDDDDPVDRALVATVGIVDHLLEAHGAPERAHVVFSDDRVQLVLASVDAARAYNATHPPARRLKRPGASP